MTSLATTTWSPSSYQLQFNFKFRKSPTPFLFVRSRIWSSDNHRRRRIRVLCGAQNGAKSESGSDSERRRSGDSWNSSSVEDALNDWFGNPEQSSDPQQKQGIGGIMGVGLASVFLVAGLTFAAMSISKRNRSRLRPKMEPLTEQQETSLTSGEEVYKEDDDKNYEKHNVQDERNLPTDRYLEGKPGEKYTLDGHDAFIQEDSEPDSILQDVESPDTVSTLSGSPQLESVGDADAIDSANMLPVSKTEKNPDAVALTNSDTDAELLDTSDQQPIISASQTDTLHTTLESSSSTTFSVSADDAKLASTLETQNLSRSDIEDTTLVSTKEDTELSKSLQFSDGYNGSPTDISSSKDNESSKVASSLAQSSVDKEADNEVDAIIGGSVLVPQTSRNAFASRGIPAPCLLSAALQAPPGKVLVPAVVDQTQGQAVAALQVLKVIESDAQAGDLCTRREYARWLVSASSSLSRNSISKVYPAMYIENVTELAFDDITPEDPDFTSIQGLAEAGLISSKLSRRDMLSSPEEDIGSFYFHPNSPLSRQDLVTWKMALEKRQLPEADRKILHQLSGFIDIDKIDPDAWPALVADVSAGEQGIVALAFGYTRLFQPDKPVTKGQAAIALATGEAADAVSEELARIEAESIAENAVAAHNALVAEVEKDMNASFEKELLMEREKIDAVQKMAEEARNEVDRLKGMREEENIALMKERAAIESEMEVFSRLRHELEEQLQSLMSNKVEISYEKERIEKLRKETEEENQAISRLQYELEVERKALSMARAWAEDEAKRVQEYSKALEEARDRWERQGIKVVVDKDLQEEASAGATWVNVGKKLSVEETVDRAENLTDKLKIMAAKVSGRSKEIINKIIEKIRDLISVLKEWISAAGRRTTEFRDVATAKVGGSVQQLQQHVTGFGATVQEGAKRVAGDCREGVEKLTQRFKT